MAAGEVGVVVAVGGPEGWDGGAGTRPRGRRGVAWPVEQLRGDRLPVHTDQAVGPVAVDGRECVATPVGASRAAEGDPGSRLGSVLSSVMPIVLIDQTCMDPCH